MVHLVSTSVKDHSFLVLNHFGKLIDCEFIYKSEYSIDVVLHHGYFEFLKLIAGTVLYKH